MEFRDVSCTFFWHVFLSCIGVVCSCMVELLCEFPSIKYSGYYGHSDALLFFGTLIEEYQKITTHQPAELPQIGNFGHLMWFLLQLS